MKKLLLIALLFSNAALFAAGTATVVRAHPYLTRGLEKESLIGIRFDNSYGGAPSTINVQLEFKNCSTNSISELELWYQKAPVYAFYPDKAEPLSKLAMDAVGCIEISGITKWIYPKNANNTDSDYLWITASIDPDIPTNAEIRVSITNTEISLGDNKYDTIVGGVASSPHRVFPYYFKSGAYFRQDKVTGTSGAPLEDATDARLKSLNDIILINDLEPVYNAATKTISTTWDKRYNNDGLKRDNTAGVKYVQGLRDKYHSEAMVRIGLTKGEPIFEGSRYPLSLAIETEEGRASLVNQIVGLMSELKVDGLDIDWEYPGMKSVWNADKTKLVAAFDSVDTWKKDWHNYGLLMRDLSAAFFDHGWVLSMCTNLGYLMPSYSADIMPSEAVRKNYFAVLHVPDYIDSMAYGDKDINASPLVMQKAIKVITDCGVNNRRIVVGQAIYSFEHGNRGWDWDVKRLMEQEPYKSEAFRRYDTDVVYVKENGATEATKNVFEGPSSYHAKVAWCREHDMGGAMSWGYYSDINWDGSVMNTELKTGLMSLGRHHARSLPMIKKGTYPTPEKVGNVYKLKSESDWCWLRDHNDVSAEFDNDITLNHDPLIITQWKGTLDGNGHKLIIPEDVWLCYEDNAALINTLNGTIKNLTIDLYGRVVSRASRWNDTTCKGNENTLTRNDKGEYTDHLVAVLACEARWGANIENVKLIVHNGAEVQGPVMTGGLVAKVEVAGGNTAKITNSTIINAGLIHSIAYNTAEKAIHLGTVPKVGSIAANTILTGENTKIVIENNLVEAKTEPLFGVRATNLTASGNALRTDGTALNAYLLNCSVADLPTKKAAFKLTITIDNEGKPVISAPEGYNGTIKILGAADLKGTWSENNPDAKYFKAELSL